MSRLAPAFLVVLFSACDSITESEDPDPVGTYELHSLDGNPVPYSFIDEYGDTIVVTQGTLFMGENLPILRPDDRDRFSTREPRPQLVG